jgi:Coenzyme PQQ synthesis protein D (PqqD)
MRRLRLDPAAVQWRELEGEVLAIDFAGSRYLGVNESGAVLWPLLAEGATVTELTRALAERFSLDSEQARSDVDSFLSWLQAEQLLLDEESPAG